MAKVKVKGETSYSRNYSIGSRDMAIAGQKVVEQRFHGGFQSKRDIGQRWAYFCKWAEPQGIKRMEKISKELVIEYGQALQQELDAGERKSPSSPKNYVSAVNTVMRLATQGEWKTVKPGKDCGIQARSYIPTESKAMSMATHQTAQRAVDDRISSLLGLQRAFGLRFKESCLLNPKLALKEALKDGRITLRAGTKGGKLRRVPCRPCGITALEQAIAVQDGRSLIPKNISYADFQKACYEQARLAEIGFHSERHFYAQDRYREITGAPSPVEAGWSRKERIFQLALYLNISEEEAQKIDAVARLQISLELGHHRVEISNAYLG
ncbi:integrase domain-containing protein [Methylomonas sp. AM2-LC]|uniref:integrase domain-containing protein n=1 Tax=Methylomonas sp. AM2-LC TaxID=3153301 RepID=UPI0032677CF9